MGPAQLVGRSFRDLPALDAYRLDLLGSLCGIAAFTAFAFLGLPPLVWGLVLVALFVALLGTARIVTFACAVLIALFVVDLASDEVTWSPYYRIVHRTVDFGGGEVGLDVSVNGVPHQTARGAKGGCVTIPCTAFPITRLRLGSPGRVLVIGAGTGNDVSIALTRGAEHVDAVEIDPEILALGRRLHPDKPYQDPRVTAHVDDGRAFLERTNEQYDLILFALPDSLALVTGGGAIRLESYLFTREAMEAVRAPHRPWRIRDVQPLQTVLAGGSICRDGRVCIRSRALHRHVAASRPARPSSPSRSTSATSGVRITSHRRAGWHRRPTTVRFRTSVVAAFRRSTCSRLPESCSSVFSPSACSPVRSDPCGRTPISSSWELPFSSSRRRA